MASLVISRTVRVGGVLTDLPSPPVLRDPTAAFGVRRVDTGAVILAAGTAIPRQSTGVYSLQVDDLVAQVQYQYYIEATLSDGSVSRVEKLWTAPADATSSSYLTLAEADALAATMLASQVSHFTGATSGDRTAALAAASLAIDTAMRYQGRPYDATQTLAFPRIAYEHVGQPATRSPDETQPTCYPSVVWDWDEDTSAAVVPERVKQATLFQANHLLDSASAERLARLEMIRVGMTSRSTGQLSESYGPTLAGASELQLCLPAASLVAKYRLRSGRIG